MIMSHMVDQMKRKTGSLPYGMLLPKIFEDAQIDISNEASQNFIYSDTYNKNSLRRMGSVKVEKQWICRESQVGISKDEPREENPSEEEHTLTDEPSTSFHTTNKMTEGIPTLSHDTLTTIIELVVKIVKEEPLKEIINTTLTEVLQSEIFRDTLITTIQSVHSVNPILKHRLIIERKIWKEW